MPRFLKSASLDLIAKANGKPTGDEMVRDPILKEPKEFHHLTEKQIKRLKCSLRKCETLDEEEERARWLREKWEK